MNKMHTFNREKWMPATLQLHDCRPEIRPLPPRPELIGRGQFLVRFVVHNLSLLLLLLLFPILVLVLSAALGQGALPAARAGDDAVGTVEITAGAVDIAAVGRPGAAVEAGKAEEPGLPVCRLRMVNRRWGR